jgi:hypothetical protein
MWIDDWILKRLKVSPLVVATGGSFPRLTGKGHTETA